MSGLDARLAADLGAFTLDVRFTAPPRGVTALFGPSGCGKTTVLRCVAGLTRVPSGELRLDDTVWQDARTFLPPHRRPVGYVFQEASLFPHLSVRRNLLYGQRRAATDAGIAFDEVVALLGLERLVDRRPARLSGGERQRVAIGRALLSQPRLLLMDEPLSALDRFSKDEILPYLERLHRRLSIPALYVSHDLSEVERLADHVVLLAEGRVRASGPLATLATRLDLPLSRAAGAAAVLDGTVAEVDTAHGLSRLTVAGGSLWVPGAAWAVGTRHRLRVPAQDVSLVVGPPARSSILNVLPGVIHAADDTAEGGCLRVVVGLGEAGTGEALLAAITRRSWHHLGLSVGQPVHVQVKSVGLVAEAE